ncbi:methionyl-tRNA formyltransferase, mitochondrial [Anoplophora glabripennis]|uniref:methionyl-tRNA formyltransferase, mitochondrial n=1 Tax=Anoplophora glabripennis TaxID=217634 RepID=UPI0008759A6B|nr:methionyl-tRNA formyltransferase, mitochondrial [Anoplophora glabripennis]
MGIFKNAFKKIHSNSFAQKPPWKILFFGTDEFSVYSLKALYREYINGTVLKKLEVVTTTKGKANPVRKYADEHKLLIHSWPVTVPEYVFDVGLVVSFGHLIPESVISKFPLGMLNVHASLLPRWRGAAPIIYTLANGDTETGITIMRIRPKQFDIGEILMQANVLVSSHAKMPELYETLGGLGAKSLISCLEDLQERLANAKPQPDEGVTFAPKVSSEFAVVSWEDMTSTQIYNRERAVTGLFSLTSSWNGIPVKLVGVTDCKNCDALLNSKDSVPLKPGFVKYDKKRKTLIVVCADKTLISVDKIGIFGKRVMTAMEFNNGYIKKEPVENRCFKFRRGTT